MSPRRLLPVRALAAALALAAAGAFGVAGQVPTARADGGPGPVGGPLLGRPGVVADLPAGVPAPPAMPDAAYVLADMDTGAVLAAKAAHARHLPASTLKTLAALVLIPQLDPRASVVATVADASADGTRVGILPGTAYPVRTLFLGMLMASGNDAAYALSRAGGGIPRTVAAMNAKARWLGAFDTLARDPSGLDRPGQTSSAFDLALIGRAAMQLPDFRGYVTTKQIRFPGGRVAGGKVRAGFFIQNHDRLLYNYPGTIGIKNGYTVAAKQTFIGAATRAGHTYIVAEMAGTTGSWRPTAKLLDWAFAYGGRVRPVGRLVDPGSVQASSGTPADSGGPGGGDGAAAAAVPGSLSVRAAARTTVPPLRPWVGVAGLLSAVGLVGALAIRTTRRHRG